MSRYFPDPAECGRHVIFGNVPIRTFAGDHLQLSLVDIPPRGLVDWHDHPNEQIGMVVVGRLTFFIGDEVRTLGPGDFYCIPGGVRHRVEGHEIPSQALDIFHPVRNEYR